ncbi:MAG: ABC transporter permease [Dissulfurimicrobium sp.]|uniref:ABC transporter permease n=1 Tax=Dissulfurimicrobium sp. TaxID=2022436 RepID=UPI00404AD4B4
MRLLFSKIWLRNARVWMRHLKASLIGNLGQPFMFLLAMGYGLGRQIPAIHGLSYLQFIAPGLVTTAVMYSAAFESTYGSYTRLTTQHTFEAILMTPVSVNDLVIGEVIWGATKGLISGIIMLLSLPLFGVWPSYWVLALVPVLFFEGVFFAALGLITTALADNYDFFNYFTSLLITPLFLFSGVFFPIESLNPVPKAVLLALPLTHTVSLARRFCYGDVSDGWVLSLSVIVAAALVTTFISVVLMRRRLIR